MPERELIPDDLWQRLPALELEEYPAEIIRENALNLLAPLVVAGELRRLAGQFAAAAHSYRDGGDFHNGQAQGHADAESVLLRRAEELERA